jgi:uncharacterized protein YhhL (DUF1145 family)
MFFALKLALLALYAAALAGFAGLLPTAAADRLQNIALVLLAIHAVELLVTFKHVKRYPGGLTASILLTLLFGLLHWRPLAQQAAASTRLKVPVRPES